MDKKAFWRHFLLVALLILFFTLCWNYETFFSFLSSFCSSVIFPVFLGLCIAFVINIPASFFEKIFYKVRFRRTLSLFLALLSILIVLAVIIGFIIPELVNTFRILTASVKSFSESLSEYLASDSEKPAYITSIVAFVNENVDSIILKTQSYLKDNSSIMVSGVFGAVSTTLSSVISFFISLIISFYFISNKEMLAKDLKKLSRLLFPAGFVNKAKHILCVMNISFRKFIIAQCLEALIIGILCMAGMFILQMPYAVMIGSLVGVTALIPIYGGIFGAIVGAFMIAVVSPMKGVVFLIFIIVLQQLEGNLIYPNVVGTSMGLPGVYTFLSVTILGSIGGLAGMLFAVPLACTLYVLIKEAHQARQLPAESSQQ